MFPQINPKNIACSLEINDHVPLFPETPGRRSQHACSNLYRVLGV